MYPNTANVAYKRSKQKIFWSPIYLEFCFWVFSRLRFRRSGPWHRRHGDELRFLAAGGGIFNLRTSHWFTPTGPVSPRAWARKLLQRHSSADDSHPRFTGLRETYFAKSANIPTLNFAKNAKFRMGHPALKFGDMKFRDIRNVPSN